MKASNTASIFSEHSSVWWDHLPSPEVLNRGNTSGPPPGCPAYCDDGRQGSSWHLLAEYQHPTLHRVRAAVTNQVRLTLTRKLRDCPQLLSAWSAGFLTGPHGDCWTRPGGADVGACKAGVTPVPWYGSCFPYYACLDQWGATYTPRQGESRAGHWSRGKRLLGERRQCGAHHTPILGLGEDRVTRGLGALWT